MKVITIIQPWATLIALGEKRIETRSWKTSHRGELLIHAGKKIDKDILEKEPYKSILSKHGINTYKDLATGVILAKCKLERCLKMTDKKLAFLTEKHSISEDGMLVAGQEYEFGYYEPGRYAWVLNAIEMLENPIAAQGQLNLWNYDI